MDQKFDIKTFKKEFRELGSEFNLENIEEFIKNVEEDYEMVMNFKNFDVPPDFRIPPKYFGQELDYLILQYFHSYFLSSLDESIAIGLAFENTNINKISISDSENDGFVINDNNLELLKNNKSILSNIFNELGTNLFGNSFSQQDFLSNSDE